MADAPAREGGDDAEPERLGDETCEVRETLRSQKVAALMPEGHRGIAAEHREVDDSKREDIA
jgi:hypothetical protein